ncbi:hypothetical protein C8N47_1088 [Mangrovibacterium marinum]|uniref:Uncharacterized protein n=1 Tax=Mangrovibacterium marinum TaxID=1639118 RepID=A0A2T5C1G1_9BACT|nr:hypothetical protein C8N47_1088 [Mangrovibacterium marinum]
MDNRKNIAQDSMADLSSDILRMTMVIWEYYPELYSFLDEMPTPKPSNENTGITENQLETYYKSLNWLLSRYILEHSISSK